MTKALTVFLTTPPFAHENSYTVLRLIEAALEKGYPVNLFASADGVHNFTTGQRASGLPEIGSAFEQLIQKGLHVELCGSCLGLRGIGREDVLPGSNLSSMKRLFGLIKNSDVFITLGT